MSALFNIECGQEIPISFHLSSEVLELTSKEYTSYDFKTELEFVSSHDDLKDNSPRTEPHIGFNLNEGAINVSPSPTTSTSQIANASSISNTARDTDRIQQEALQKDSQVTAMTLQTGQSRDECMFYLESCNWEMEAAIKMLNEFTLRN